MLIKANICSVEHLRSGTTLLLVSTSNIKQEMT